MSDQQHLITSARDLPGFHNLLGYHHVSWVEDETVIELEIRPEHLNLAGVIHGGVLSALMDIVMADAGTYCPYPGRRRKALTLTMTTTFTGQCSGGVIRATGRKRAGGARIFNSSGEIHDDKGNLLAMGEGTFRIRSGSEGPEGVPI
ncbi:MULTISPECIES: PaaI family thioesterase [Marinobacter]|uniref:Phenylacetic acid degradation-related protein n=1 Tax=Marinobacter profundi TaxID=2666256 RepID=A0A2G1ULN1_9GAMM|nr:MULTISPECIES: PaaI family thioesterase [Marinobacter]MBD3658364.1 PaaI family thioesterase [Marinobacter sp.]PHQ15345.1 phenylacetic acid degradation-related protein [Marinobacter profundi]